MAAIKWHRKRWVNRSDLFDGFEDIWEDVTETNPPFSFGDNDHTLVKASLILLLVENLFAAHTVAVAPESYRDKAYWKKIIQRLEALPKNTLVDLEN